MSQESNSLPQEDINQILQCRRDKLVKLRAQGINPYPYTFAKDTHIPDLLTDFDSKMEDQEHSGPMFSIAGRLHTIRLMGKAAFCHVRDEFGIMQVYVQRDCVGDEAFAIFKMMDIGDIVGFHGTAFRTKTNEPSVRARTFELLSKSLHPLPVVKEREGETYDAFTDKEARFRERHVDLAVNPDVRTIFRKRAKIISTIRDFLDSRGYLEVETPTLQPLYGGALAKPFTTFYNALDRTFYLRIADELYLKRLLVGGFEKVYEICKDFRNESMDRDHNPEFTMLEFYQAYADFWQVMDLAEEMFRYVAQAVLGTTEVHYQGDTVDFGKPFRRVKFFDLLADLTGRDLLGIELPELIDVAKKHNIEVTKEMGEGKILDELMKKHIRPKLKEPTMIYDYPLSLSPLAKVHRSDKRLVERFQPFALGFELGNAFSELNDPLDQRNRFEKQRALKEAGDEETQPVDEGFLGALEYAMPPTGGMGIGVDRLTMLLTDSDNISSVILFPHVRTTGKSDHDIYKATRQLVVGHNVTFEDSQVSQLNSALDSSSRLSFHTELMNLDQNRLLVAYRSREGLHDTFFYTFARWRKEYKAKRKQQGFNEPIGSIVVCQDLNAPSYNVQSWFHMSYALGFSLLTLSDLATSISLVEEKIAWILNVERLVAHRPWCMWGLKLSNGKRISESDIPQDYRSGSCCD